MRRTGRSLTNELTDVIHETIRGMDDNDLLLVLKRLKKLTTSNCGWDVYALREGLREMVKMHLRSRRQQDRMLRKNEVKA